MAAIRILTFIALGILLLAIRSSAYLASSALVYTCQSKKMREFRCRVFEGNRQGIIDVISVTVLTNSDIDEIESITASDASGGCQWAEECRRTIHSSTDTGISDGYKHLYEWILNKCQGKPACDVMGENDTMPKWSDLTSDVPRRCGQADQDKIQYFASALVDITCLVGEEVATVQPPPSTTPRTRPTTPIYQPHLAEIEPSVFVISQEKCAGETYTLGCGTGDGTSVMNVTQVYIFMDTEDEAFHCGKAGLCEVIFGTGQDDEVKDYEALVNLHKSIVHNCQGKASCTGTLPVYSDVKVAFPEGSFGFNCGWFDFEYLSYLIISVSCQDAGTIETLPPYEYETPTGDSTVAAVTTTTTTTTPPTTTTTTTTKVTPKTPATTPPGKAATGKRTDAQAINKKKTEMLIVFAVLGSVAAVAVVVGVIVAIYVLVSKTGSGDLNRSSSPTEYPLHDTEKADLPLEDKDSPLYT